MHKAPSDVANTAIGDILCSMNQAYASLCFYGDQLDPETISQLLRRSPTFASRKDALLTDRTGNVRKQETGCWILESRDIVTSESLEIHVNSLIDILEQAKADIVNVAGIEIRTVYVYWNCGGRSGGPMFSCTTLQRLSHYQLSLWIDIYP